MKRVPIPPLLKQLRSASGLSGRDVARKLALYGISLSEKTLYGYENGVSMPNADVFLALCSIYDCEELVGLGSAADFSMEEYGLIKKYRVLDVHGKRVVDSALELEYDRITHVVERKETGNITYINCYDLAVSAGPGEPWADDSGYKTMLEIPTEQVPENAHYCARVNGNSMEPAYKDGDIVFVERLDELVREGEIGIFALNGEGYIKRLGDRELISLNPEYDPIPLHEFDDLRCQGRVLGKLGIS